MKCPIDDTQLAITERQGVEIDYCPKCRGVWLDRGELDKIIEKSGNGYEERPPRHESHREDHREDHRDPRYDDRRHNKKHKRESFLGDLFDF